MTENTETWRGQRDCPGVQPGSDKKKHIQLSNAQSGGISIRFVFVAG